MISLAFEKLHGLGNDFMLLDWRDGATPLTLNAALIAQWADRRYGVGFDQLIVLSQQPAGIQYQFYNADGGAAEQCGNGQRAIAHYLYRQGELDQPITIMGAGGPVTLSYQDEDHISVELAQKITQQAQTIAGVNGHYVNLGNPHWAYVAEDLQASDLPAISAQARQVHESGVNTEAISRINDQHIRIRVIERGVGETLACGSGACAAAIAAGQLLGTGNPITVSMPGGDVQVNYDLDCDKIKLTGPARLVYRGQINHE
ncbi:diaminopimelate epimerase [Marinicella sediminis]|uniref:Diaminopimelate epimerase n=1 Tax=Marinicella sediminis TaxID=1792834 RepID=A0ABV7J3F1_9GAMM|nr:diaminopimelate epimerase [Marinicella sediminis]